MAYRLNDSEAVDEELGRVVEEQIDRGVGEIDDPELEARITVHQVRKRCKKIRAALRLARGPLDKDDVYARENAWFRDVAAALSGLRDAEVLIETHDALAARITNPDIKAECDAIRDGLATRHRELAGAGADPGEKLDAARSALLEGRGRVREWTWRVRNFHGLAPGLKRSYRRGRRAMKTAHETLADEAFHEWRKRVKYHWYACRLLQPVWPEAMDARRREAGRLADLLGDEHDLSVYREVLESEPDRFGGRSRLRDILAAVDQQRTGLRREARSLGMRLYVEKPAQLCARLSGYWDAWRAEKEQQAP